MKTGAVTAAPNRMGALTVASARTIEKYPLLSRSVSFCTLDSSGNDTPAMIGFIRKIGWNAMVHAI